MSEKLAPIALFVYSRVDHVTRTIDALVKNPEAGVSDLYVFSDGSRNEHDAAGVAEVRGYIRTISGFRNVFVVERMSNFGLARSIVEGVSDVIQKSGRIIVLEDDIVTAPGFLKFMNTALNLYVDNNKVWHISGWNYPIDTDGLDDAFFLPIMNCWGWATWQDRWSFFEKDPEKLVQTFTRTQIKAFNLGGVADLFDQVVQNADKKRNTWAIFWYATIFLKGGLCLNPSTSLVYNIGNDGSGENCGYENIYGDILSQKAGVHLPVDVVLSLVALERIRSFYRTVNPGLLGRVVRKARRLLEKLM